MRIETLKNLAEQIKAAGEVWQEWAGQEELVGDGMDEWLAYRGSVVRALEAIAEDHGLSISVEREGASAYVSLEREDGEGGISTVCQVRVSNHGQRYSGPLWSFEPPDDLETVLAGLSMIDEACAGQAAN